MSKPETTFIGSVHKHLPPGRSDPYWMKNNNIYTAGIWDCWYSGRKADLWVEYKFVVLPKTDSVLVKPDLSVLQLKWGAERYKEGRNLAVIIGCTEGGVILRDHEWKKPLTRAEFIKLLRTRKEVAEWIKIFTHGSP